MHRISVLANFWYMAGRFRRLVGTNSWAILLVRRDRSMPAALADRLPTYEEAVAEADARWAEALQLECGSRIAHASSAVLLCQGGHPPWAEHRWSSGSDGSEVSWRDGDDRVVGT